MPEAPRCVKGDARGEIAVPEDGQWTEALREAYADRIEAILAAHIEGFEASVVTRRAISPADLEGYNMNLVGGDPYGGACSLDQFFLWRPFADSVRHSTGIANLYHIGASTTQAGAIRRVGISDREGVGRMMDRTEDLEEFTPYLMNRIMARYNKGVEAALKEAGVSVAQMRALVVLAESGPCTINELSVLTVIKQSTLSRTLDTMENAGLLAREARDGG